MPATLEAKESTTLFGKMVEIYDKTINQKIGSYGTYMDGSYHATFFGLTMKRFQSEEMALNYILSQWKA